MERIVEEKSVGKKNDEKNKSTTKRGNIGIVVGEP